MAIDRVAAMVEQDAEFLGDLIGPIGDAAGYPTKLARLHAGIANVRKAATRKATTHLTKTFKHIGIEDLNVGGMARNPHLARSIMDGGFGEFRRQLEYKARFCGATFVVADRWFASSKTCSCCGSVKDELPYRNGPSIAMRMDLSATAT